MEKSAQIDGLKVRYLEEGSGPPVVMLHGASLGSSADVWEGTLGPLSKGGFRAIAFDQPGYGGSDNLKDYKGYSPVDFLLKFMDTLGIDRACLIGHSMTGGIVVRTALQFPNRVTKAITVGTGSLLPTLPDQGSRGRGEGDEEDESEPTLEDARKLLESNLFNKSLATPAAVEKRHQMSIGKNFQASIERSKARAPRNKDEVPLWQRLTELRPPLLMIYGAQDRGSAAKKCALLKEKEPGLRIELIDNAAHLVMWDGKETFNRKVLDFLRG